MWFKKQMILEIDCINKLNPFDNQCIQQSMIRTTFSSFRLIKSQVNNLQSITKIVS